MEFIENYMNKDKADQEDFDQKVENLMIPPEIGENQNSANQASQSQVQEVDNSKNVNSKGNQQNQDQAQIVDNLKKEESDENQHLQETVKKEGKLKNDTQTTNEKMVPEPI